MSKSCTLLYTCTIMDDVNVLSCKKNIENVSYTELHKMIAFT